nr:MAG TPA: hypothetical protein [Bacteriophage sp.]
MTILIVIFKCIDERYNELPPSPLYSLQPMWLWAFCFCCHSIAPDVPQHKKDTTNWSR